MKHVPVTVRTSVNFQPAFRLVDLFIEQTSYTKSWELPFNMLAIFLEDDPEDPSWVEVPEQNLHCELKRGLISFTTCNTPLTLHYTPANRHACIHFNYELLPGIDLFFGLRQRYMFRDAALLKELKAVFSDPDPLRRLARAESAAMKMVMRYWPERMPLDLHRMAEFEDVLRYVRKNLASHPGVPEMAARMGWSDAHFARTFREVFHITPKQYLTRELFAESLKLLNDPGKSIKEIAAELGFSSEFNFSRFIKQCSGLAPSGLRKGNDRPLYIRK